MVMDEQALRDVVEEVVRQIRAEGGIDSSGSPYSGVFDEINGAVYAADTAFTQLADTSLEVRRAMIASMRAAATENAERLSRLAVQETGMGRVEDKIVKNRLAAERTPGVEDLEPLATTDDEGLVLTERAPYGVIGAITPSTNPTETIINNAIGMIAAGNTVVFNPHPSAHNVSALTVTILNDAIQKAGGPRNVITTVDEPTIASATEMMKHPMVRLLVVTGGPGVVRAALATTKKVIAAGPGNPPVVVDETADLTKAARDIIAGASLDNNVICIDEKEVLAVDRIADPLKKAMVSNGAFEITSDQTERLTKEIIADPGRRGHEGAANKKYVGKDAAVIAEAINLSVPSDTRVLLCEVDRAHPLIWTEQLMPVLPIARFASADEAIDYAVQCEHGFRHTASVHSNDIRNLSRMAKVMNCSLFVKNGPNYSGLAAGGPGFTSYTIASPTGEGFTRARTFTRERRCTLIGSFRIV
jgi:acyl-CoA reductase-like NAD-dependent aldehyde dehydrogenase